MNNDEVALQGFPSNRKFPIIKSTNLPSVVGSNPSTLHGIKIPKASFNKTTGMFINFKKRTSSNFNERENNINNNNQDEYLKQTNDFPKTKRLIPTDMNHRIKIRSSESNENIRAVRPSRGLRNTYYHKALIPIGAGSSCDINCGDSNTNHSDSKTKHVHNEENNDSFINELEDILTGVNNKGNSNEEVKNANVNNANVEGHDEDEQQVPDPRINFEQINEVNKSRPQTSYGGLNARRKKLQIALKSAKYRTSNNNNINNNMDK